MKLKELETSLEKHRTICYKKDGNSITYHNKDMRQVEGNVYCGEPKAESQWNSYCMLYVLYPEQKVAMEIGAVNADYDTAEAANVATRNGIETQDAFINTIKRKIEAQEHIQLSWIEYLKYIRPTLIDACWESRKAFADRREQIRQQRKSQKEAEDKAFLEEKQAEVEKLIATAYEIIKSGGTLQNDDISIYKSRYESSTYKIVNYLFRKHGVNCPIKTQGWINDKLIHVVITPEGAVNVRFWKSKNGKCSEKVFDSLLELVRIVRAADQKGEIENDMG